MARFVSLHDPAGGWRRGVAPLASGLIVFAFAWFVLATKGDRTPAAAFWPAGGILLAILMRRPGDPLLHIASATLSSWLACVLAGVSRGEAAIFAGATVAEVLLALALLRRFRPRGVSFVRPPHVGWFCVAALAGSALSATIGVPALALSGHVLDGWMSWFGTELLGLFIMTPLIAIAADVREGGPDIRFDLGVVAAAGMLLGLALLTAIVFAQSRYPLLFLPFAALLAVTYRSGPLGATGGVLIVAMIGAFFTGAGRGPIVLTGQGPLAATLFLQVYLTVLAATALPLAALLAARDRLARRIGESHRLLSMAESLAQVGHWRLDLVRQSLIWSAEVYRIYGRPADRPPTLDEALLGYHPEDRPMVEARIAAMLAGGADFEYVARLLRPDGSVRHVASRGQPEHGPDGTIVGMFGIFQDITAQIEAEHRLRDGEARYRLLADHATDIIFRLSRERTFLYVSPALTAVTGVAVEAMIGRDPFDATHRDDQPAVTAVLDRLWSGSKEQEVVTYRTRCADGRWLWLEVRAKLVVNDGHRELVGVARDISERIRIEADLVAASEAAERAAAEARKLAETDDLTGLMNRRRFLHELGQEVAASARGGRPLALAMLDVDHFKRVNDRDGHAAGDAVLRRIAVVMGTAIRRGDHVGRLGGEEFAILMPGADLAYAAQVAETIRAAIEADVPRGWPCGVTVSIGVAVLGAITDPARLLAAADGALYAAKEGGRNQFRLAA